MFRTASSVLFQGRSFSRVRLLSTSDKTVYAGHKFWKKTGCLDLTPTRPVLTENERYFSLQRPGTVAFRFFAAKGGVEGQSNTSYDWKKSSIFNLNPNEIGQLLAFLRNNTRVKLEFTHNNSGKDFSDNQQANVTPFKSTLVFVKTAGSVNITTSSEEEGKMEVKGSVVLNEGEVMVTEILLSHVLPGLAAWGSSVVPKVEAAV